MIGHYWWPTVADQLSEAGHQVRIYDRDPRGQDMIVGDPLNAERLSHVVVGSDAVYNFAGLADLNTTLDHPLETARVNIFGNVQVLDACRQHRVKRFVYASICSQTESDSRKRAELGWNL